MVKHPVFFSLMAALVGGWALMAQAASVNNPAGHWTIGPIAAKASSGAGFCSMKASYQEGQDLVFALDERGAGSIAIDFHNKALTVGSQYTVAMKAAGVARRMTAIAATAEVMIIQMGDDPAFYGALRKGSVLEVGFNDQRLDFGLDGTADGLDVLEECAGDLVGGKPVVAEIAAPKPQPPVQKKKPAIKKSVVAKAPVSAYSPRAAEDAQLKEEIARLKREKNQLLLEKEALLRKIHTEEETAMRAQVELETQAALQQSLQRLQAENSKLKEAAEAPSAVAMPGNKLVRSSSFSTDNLYGSIEEQALEERRGAFENAVDSYLKKAGHMCRGDFAHKLSGIISSGSMKMQKGEIACIDDVNDAVAAIFFFQKGLQLTVGTYEGSTDQVDLAIEKRDTEVSKYYQ